MTLLTMDSLHGFQAKAAKHEHVMNDLVAIGHSPSKAQHLLIIRLPDFRGLNPVANMILLGLIIAALPSLSLAVRGLPLDTQTTNPETKVAFGPTNLEALSMYFHKLSNEGNLKAGDKLLVITCDNDINAYDSQIFGNSIKIEFISNTDLQRQSSFPNEYFDFVFTHNLSKDRVLIDRMLRVGGVVLYEYTGKDHLGKIHSPSNYKVIYLHRFEYTTIITLQKTNNGDTNTRTNLSTKRKLLGVTTADGKKEVLEKLEDVLLEPPRASRPRGYLKRTRYLPDLLGDSLESYPRRVFIDVGPPETASPAGDLGWFGKHYPTRNKDFEIYRIDTVAEGTLSDEVAQFGISDWLRRNVREEEYVVIKAEAEVVEEMVKNRALDLVDELFLECRYQGVNGQSKRSRRAYWECLALYGRLRDEGVAVHQWWG